MAGRGFAHKLVLDNQGTVATAIITPTRKDMVTRDGDVVPILDDFVQAHPDFSLNGAKGVIAVTGFEGILGYRTQAVSPSADAVIPVEKILKQDTEIIAVQKVVERLKATGWRFASHSYSHDHVFQMGEITLDELKADTEQWKNEVGTLVGPTDIFVGPFGQVFQPGDPRRAYLVSQGFKMLCGVGADLYLHYFSDHVVMDRADIDGYRLRNTPTLLKAYFNPSEVMDPF